MFLITLVIIIISIGYLINKYILKPKYPDLSNFQNKKIIIIGAGFSGILCAISLKKMKFHNFIIYEM